MKRAGGGKRNGRKPTRVESDDRPRGYEATRMRELWRDIDDAKHKAGIGPAPEPQAAAPWDVAALFERATALVGDAAAWMTTNAPVACALLASGTELLRSVPLVGRLVDLVPVPPTPRTRLEPAAPSREPHANGSARPIVVEPERSTDPGGGWIH